MESGEFPTSSIYGVLDLTYAISSSQYYKSPYLADYLQRLFNEGRVLEPKSDISWKAIQAEYSVPLGEIWQRG